MAGSASAILSDFDKAAGSLVVPPECGEATGANLVSTCTVSTGSVADGATDGTSLVSAGTAGVKYGTVSVVLYLAHP